MFLLGPVLAVLLQGIPIFVIHDRVSCEATVIDNSGTGTAGVQFYLNNTVPLGPVLTTAPYIFVWDTNSIPNGNYAIVAHATDNAQGVGVSNVVLVHVENPYQLFLR